MSVANTEPDDGPLPLRLAVLGLWIEAVFAGALAILALLEVLQGNTANPGIAVLLSLTTAGLAAALYWLGALLTRRRSWPRGAAIVIQLMALPVAFFMVTGESGVAVTIAGTVLGVYCLICAGLLLAPSSRL